MAITLTQYSARRLRLAQWWVTATERGKMKAPFVSLAYFRLVNFGIIRLGTLSQGHTGAIQLRRASLGLSFLEHFQCTEDLRVQKLIQKKAPPLTQLSAADLAITWVGIFLRVTGLNPSKQWTPSLFQPLFKCSLLHLCCCNKSQPTRFAWLLSIINALICLRWLLSAQKAQQLKGHHFTLAH